MKLELLGGNRETKETTKIRYPGVLEHLSEYIVSMKDERIKSKREELDLNKEKINNIKDIYKEMKEKAEDVTRDNEKLNSLSKLLQSIYNLKTRGIIVSEYRKNILEILNGDLLNQPKEVIDNLRQQLSTNMRLNDTVRIT